MLRYAFLTLLAGAAQTALADANLSEKEARVRAESIQDPQYDLRLDLTSKQEFRGEVGIQFQYKKNPGDLRLDFAKGTVDAVTLNGKKIAFRYDKAAIFLPGKELRAGAQDLRVRFKHPYSKDGSGLYRFEDPEDKRSYLYTQFEAFDANQMFPNFDQPDLKGQYALTVTAPADWTIVTTTREAKVEETKGGKVWTFPKTMKISSYVFSLHAGPYKVWEEPTTFRIPLRLLARQSVQQFVKPEEWFAWTRYGFDFFEKAFETPYPFLKYDQLIVPDFNAGAMENVAAVTFSERHLIRGERSLAQEKRHFATLLHEQAHMWFGDLVTMRWWDDLWLNESFATFAANWALAHHDTYKKNAWIDAHGGKTWAYFADRLTSTHPIVAEVPDTDTAGANFDGITYGKGGAWVRLLSYRVGEENFRRGLKNYFAKHAYGNTTVADLVAAMEADKPGSLKDFSETWLRTAGLNSVKVEARCEKGILKAIDVQQSAPKEHPTLRQHSMELALFADPKGAGPWAPARTMKIDYEGASFQQKIETGEKCPAFIFPNAGDQDYVKVEWTPEQWAVLRRQLPQLADPLLRALTWDQLNFALEDGQMSVDEAVAFVVENLPLETEYSVWMNAQSLLRYRLHQYVQMFPDRQKRVEVGSILARLFEGFAQDPKRSKDQKLFAIEQLIAFHGLAENADGLAKLYEGKLEGVTVDQPKRWDILRALAALQDSRTLAWAKKEKDSANVVDLNMRAIESSLASYTEKEKILERTLKKAGELSRQQIRNTFEGLFPWPQRDARQAFRALYEKKLPTIAQNKIEHLRNSYVLSLLPVSCEEGDDKLLDQVMHQKLLPVYIHQDIVETRDQMRRCRALVESSKRKVNG